MASKSSRTEQPVQQDQMKSRQEEIESMEHPRKEAQSCNQDTAEGKDPLTASTDRHPNGHKVRTVSEVESSLHRTSYLPLSDTYINWDVWFQPHSVVSSEKGFVRMIVEELYDGKDLHTGMHEYGISGDDLLKMLYLADMFENDYFTMPRVPYESWFVDRYAELVKEKKCSDINDHASIAILLFSDDSFRLGKGTHLEVYFQKKCVHTFKDAINVFENLNCMVCKASKAKKFEYVIESRIFRLDETIHPSRLCDILGESQDPLA